MPPPPNSLQGAILPYALRDLPGRAADWRHGTCTQAELAALLREVRNAPAAGPAVMQLVLADAVTALAAAAHQVLYAPDSYPHQSITAHTNGTHHEPVSKLQAGASQATALAFNAAAGTLNLNQGETQQPKGTDEQPQSQRQELHQSEGAQHRTSAQQQGGNQHITLQHQEGIGMGSQAAATAQQQVPDVQLCTLIAQALANFSAASPAGAALVWEACEAGLLVKLLGHPSDKVHGPATMLLYQCCKSLPAIEAQLLEESSNCVWALLLQRAMGDRTGSSDVTVNCSPEGTATASRSQKQQQGPEHQQQTSFSSNHQPPGTMGGHTAVGQGAGRGAGAGGGVGGGHSTGSGGRQIQIHDCMSDTPMGIESLDLSHDLQAAANTMLARQQHQQHRDAANTVLATQQHQQHRDEGQPCSSVGHQEARQAGVRSAAAVSEWFTLLIGHLCVRQGQLLKVLQRAATALAGSGGGGSSKTANGYGNGSGVSNGSGNGNSSGSHVTSSIIPTAAAAAPGCSTAVEGCSSNRRAAAAVVSADQSVDVMSLLSSPTVPFILHIVAHELTVMKGPQQLMSSAVQPGSAAQPSMGSEAGQVQQQQPAGWWQCMLDLLHIMQQAVHACARLQQQGSSASAPINKAALTHGAASNSDSLNSHMSVKASASGDVHIMAAAVVEASLECLKSVAMHEDLGMRLTGDSKTDVVSLLCDRQQLALRLLGLLACLQPVQNPRRAAREAAASAGQGGVPDSPFLPDHQPVQQVNDSQPQVQGSTPDAPLTAGTSTPTPTAAAVALPVLGTSTSVAAALTSATASVGQTIVLGSSSVTATSPTSVAMAAPAEPSSGTSNAGAAPTAAPTAASTTASIAAATAAATTATATGGQTVPATVPAGAECRAALPAAFTQLLPEMPPYLGYRGDILAVLANVLHGRPAVADQVAGLPGAVLLILAQCQLDEQSPLAKEWAMWVIRNLCAGSTDAVRQIQELQPVAAVQSEEMKAMGLQLQLDKETGKFKVVNTQQS